MSTEQEGRPVAAAVVVDAGRVLMIRRRVREGRLLWAFPGGEVEPGETPEQAAVRETREEVALEVAAFRVLGARVHPVTGRHVTYVACEPVSGTPRVASPDEVSACAWIAFGRIPHHVPYGLFGPVQDYLAQDQDQDQDQAAAPDVPDRDRPPGRA
ncbi:NUDIX hydrolase [Streptomyces nanshensis]|uniref:NUDIX hydrolase n=1 Tax=Streptomyces nanshensis TaxID=518642 RepID=UPI00085C8B8E|nr:NUDIX hydrolase [Streptomyces nanshensis]